MSFYDPGPVTPPAATPPYLAADVTVARAHRAAHTWTLAAALCAAALTMVSLTVELVDHEDAILPLATAAVLLASAWLTTAQISMLTAPTGLYPTRRTP